MLHFETACACFAFPPPTVQVVRERRRCLRARRGGGAVRGGLCGRGRRVCGSVNQVRGHQPHQPHKHLNVLVGLGALQMQLPGHRVGQALQGPPPHGGGLQRACRGGGHRQDADGPLQGEGVSDCPPQWSEITVLFMSIAVQVKTCKNL